MPLLRSHSVSAGLVGVQLPSTDDALLEVKSCYPACSHCQEEGVSVHKAEMMQNVQDLRIDQYLMWAANQGLTDILRNDCETNHEYRRLQEDQNEHIAWTLAKRQALGNKKIWEDWRRAQEAKILASSNTEAALIPPEESQNCTCGKCIPKPGMWNFIEFDLKPLYTLGEGKYGTVICARHESELLFRPTYPGQRIVATKLIEHKNLVSFEREERFLLKFGKKKVSPELLASTKTKEWCVIVMEKGMGTLKDLKDTIPRLSESTCKRLIKEIITLVGLIHDNGFIQHDIKLANILVMHDGTLRLCDGGMSRHIESQRNNIPDFHGKNCYYIAPEVRQGKKLRKPTAVDMYCVGVVLAQLRGVSLRDGMIGAAQEAFPLDQYAEAHKFLHMLMCNPPGTRLTAAQALKHAWLRDVPPQPLDCWLEWWNPKRTPVQITDVGPRISDLFVY